MSKAITEIEKPKRCKDCVWYQADPWFGGVCVISKNENGWSREIGADEEYDVQKWCPLLPKTEVIPKEWIKKWAMKNWVKSKKCEYDIIVSKMIDDWEKENQSLE